MAKISPTKAMCFLNLWTAGATNPESACVQFMIDILWAGFKPSIASNTWRILHFVTLKLELTLGLVHMMLCVESARALLISMSFSEDTYFWKTKKRNASWKSFYSRFCKSPQLTKLKMIGHLFMFELAAFSLLRPCTTMQLMDISCILAGFCHPSVYFLSWQDSPRLNNIWQFENTKTMFNIRK